MNIFERTELKYVITLEQKEQLLSHIAAHIMPDQYGDSTIYSLYFDTPSFQLIRTSLEKPLYKEKLRLRSYGVPTPDSMVYLELKKKFKGVVYKRRISMSYTQATDWIKKGNIPRDSQIMREIGATCQGYGGLFPKMMISCNRQAFYCKEDSDLRFTFDQNIAYRTDDLSFESQQSGTLVLPQNRCVLEIKALYAYPHWLVQALDECKIFPSGFSKYGSGYQHWIASKYLFKTA